QRMPFVADLNAWQIQTLEEIGKENRATALKFDSRIKGLANTMKNYRGKLVGMKRLQLVAKKEEEEAGLQKFIDSDPQRKATYGSVLADTRKIYGEISARAHYELVLDNLPTSSLMIRLAGNVVDAAEQMAKPSAERTRPYQDASLAETKKASAGNFANYHEEAERRLLVKILTLAANVPEGQRIAPVDEALGRDHSNENVATWVTAAMAGTTLKTPDGQASAIGKTPDELRAMNDPFVNLATSLAPLQRELREARARRNAELSKLSALLIDVKQRYLQKDFIPDANGTLRFTYGRIRGYSPADATVHKPITTLTGVIEKTRDEYPYATPQLVRDLHKAKDYGRYGLPKTNELPVAILYNTDTTGGNSGSAVMNAMGELVGVNFDRAWEATINDYAWNEAYSRSIAVDIRYVLWITEKVGKATFLLEEMGVKPSGK
ncbi:MAG: S46 family peptidase, partial [Acidobacteria bacterium]